MIANIINPPLMRKNIIWEGDKKELEIFTNVSPTAKEAIEINMRKIPLEFFFWLSNIKKLQHTREYIYSKLLIGKSSFYLVFLNLDIS